MAALSNLLRDITRAVAARDALKAAGRGDILPPMPPKKIVPEMALRYVKRAVRAQFPDQADEILAAFEARPAPGIGEECHVFSGEAAPVATYPGGPDALLRFSLNEEIHSRSGRPVTRHCHWHVAFRSGGYQEQSAALAGALVVERQNGVELSRSSLLDWSPSMGPVGRSVAPISHVPFERAIDPNVVYELELQADPAVRATWVNASVSLAVYLERPTSLGDFMTTAAASLEDLGGDDDETPYPDEPADELAEFDPSRPLPEHIAEALGLTVGPYRDESASEHHSRIFEGGVRLRELIAQLARGDQAARVEIERMAEETAHDDWGEMMRIARMPEVSAVLQSNVPPPPPSSDDDDAECDD